MGWRCWFHVQKAGNTCSEWNEWYLLRACKGLLMFLLCTCLEFLLKIYISYLKRIYTLNRHVCICFFFLGIKPTWMWIWYLRVSRKCKNVSAFHWNHRDRWIKLLFPGQTCSINLLKITLMVVTFFADSMCLSCTGTNSILWPHSLNRLLVKRSIILPVNSLISC